MKTDFLIRQAQPSDYPAIYQLVEEAFRDHPHSDHTEHLIVQRLRHQDQLTISLLAHTQTQIIGYVAFSPVRVSNQPSGWYGLGPVAVAPTEQRGGIGQALIRQGLAQLKADQAAGCVVAGDPIYYDRFGFQHKSTFVVDGIPPAYFMGLSFEGTELPTGLVEYSPAFFG